MVIILYYFVPFKSKQQWKYFFSNPDISKDMAKEWAKKTKKKFKNLPKKVKKKSSFDTLNQITKILYSNVNKES